MDGDAGFFQIGCKLFRYFLGLDDKVCFLFVDYQVASHYGVDIHLVSAYVQCLFYLVH